MGTNKYISSIFLAFSAIFYFGRLETLVFKTFSSSFLAIFPKKTKELKKTSKVPRKTAKVPRKTAKVPRKNSKKYQEKTAKVPRKTTKSAKKRLQKHVKKIRSPKAKQEAVKIFSYAGVSSLKNT